MYDLVVPSRTRSSVYRLCVLLAAKYPRGVETVLIAPDMKVEVYMRSPQKLCGIGLVMTVKGS